MSLVVMALGVHGQVLFQHLGFKFTLPVPRHRHFHISKAGVQRLTAVTVWEKRGFGYLLEATVDCKHGILTGIDVFPDNEKESLLVLRHLERQIKAGVPMINIALDRSYDTGAVHRDLEHLGIVGYIPAIQFPSAPEKMAFPTCLTKRLLFAPKRICLTITV